ncbi:MAG: hypothetical protein KDC44_01440, partial [Phaeodactylibacter sp.]|nr:hypothetical protein [Phaeodactylibacter sp.]
MIHIPEYFQQSSSASAEETTVVKFYENRQAVDKSKIVVSSFLFSFVLSGEKKINHLYNSSTIAGNEFLLLKPSNCLMTERLAGEDSYRALLFFFRAETFLELEIFQSYPAAR